jgi:hypothetical protein
MRALLLGECAGDERREHGCRAPGAVEQAVDRAARPIRSCGQPVGHDVDRAARRGGEHQRRDEDHRGGADECRHQRDRAQEGDDRADRDRVRAGPEPHEHGTRGDVADRAGRECQPGRARRDPVDAQVPSDQQLSDPRQHAADPQRAHAGRQPPIPAAALPPSAPLRPLRPTRVPPPPTRLRNGERGSGQVPTDLRRRRAPAHGVTIGARTRRATGIWVTGKQRRRDRRGHRDHSERELGRAAVTERSSERRPDHRARRGAHHRLADAAGTTPWPRAQPGRARRPQPAEGDAVGDPSGEQQVQATEGLGATAEHEQRPGRQRHPTRAEAVDEHPGGDRDREHRQAG